MRLVMVIDNFEKERKFDKFAFNSPLIAGIILFFGLLGYGIYSILSVTKENIPFAAALNILILPLFGGTVLLIAGLLCTIVLKHKGKTTAKVSVNTDELYFDVNNERYYFNDLMPEFDVVKSANTKFMYWYDFVLHFKNGTSLEFTLPQSTALSFIKKYLTKYSKPSVSLKICGIKF